MKKLLVIILSLLFFEFVFYKPLAIAATTPTPTPTKTPTPTPTPTKAPPPTPKPTNPPPTSKPIPAVINPLASPAPQQSVIVKATTIIITKVKKAAKQISSFITNNILPIKKPVKKVKKKTVIKPPAKNSKYYLPAPKKINKPDILNN